MVSCLRQAIRRRGRCDTHTGCRSVLHPGHVWAVFSQVSVYATHPTLIKSYRGAKKRDSPVCVSASLPACQQRYAVTSERFGPLFGIPDVQFGKLPFTQFSVSRLLARSSCPCQHGSRDAIHNLLDIVLSSDPELSSVALLQGQIRVVREIIYLLIVQAGTRPETEATDLETLSNHFRICS